MLRCDFWLERGREDAVVCGRGNHTTSRRWFWCAFVGNRGMSSGGTQMVRDGPLGRCGRTARPFSGSGVKLSGTFWELSSQNRVYPAEMWQSSGGGRRWPIRRRPGGVANTEIEIPDFGHKSTKYTRFRPLVLILYEKTLGVSKDNSRVSTAGYTDGNYLRPMDCSSRVQSTTY